MARKSTHSAPSASRWIHLSDRLMDLTPDDPGSSGLARRGADRGHGTQVVQTAPPALAASRSSSLRSRPVEGQGGLRGRV